MDFFDLVVGALVSAIVVAVLTLFGLSLFSQLNQTITITGPLAGTGKDLLIDAADALVLAVGGTGIAFVAILILGRAGR